MDSLAKLDHRYLWHPFTQMKEWLRGEPIVVMEGEGTKLRDQRGREYLDANSSIWTNLHGHRHPKMDAAIQRQLGKIAHSSALGLANEPSSLLGRELIRSAEQPKSKLGPRLSRVFYSDNGSTAMEVALKLSFETTRRAGKKPRFLSLQNAYHGDTVGSVSLGHIDLFHSAFRGLLFKADRVAAPYCYRCPHNRARSEKVEAATARKCAWECVAKVEKKFAQARAAKKPISAMALEPVVQGAAGIIVQPEGWLPRVEKIVRHHGAHLIADEVLTGFGRTGPIFACQKEKVRPDFMALAKGMTGGYLPMAATLTTDAVFKAFLGDYQDFKTFFHGHSYTGNQLGAAAARASLKLLEGEHNVAHRIRLGRQLAGKLERLWRRKAVGDIRQAGTIAGVELVRDRNTRHSFELKEQVGIRVCQAMARRGVLTRPIGNVVVLLPPYCTSNGELEQMVAALDESIEEILG